MVTAPSFKSKNVLVTGGLGFIGSHLARRAASLGAKVSVLDCRLADHGANDFNLDGVAVQKLDLDIRDKAAGEAAASADFVFHVAGQTSHLDSMTQPRPDLDINTAGTLNLMEGIRQAQSTSNHPRPVFLYVGTRAQYGKVPGGVATEETPFHPVDAYGVSKAAGESYAFLYGRAHGIPVVSVRLTNTYGPRHQMRHSKFGILNWFIRNAMDGKDLPIYGDGSQTRDFLFIDDAVEAMIRLADWRFSLPSDGAPSPLAGEGKGEGIGFASPAFNLGTGRGYPFREMSEKVAALCGTKVITKPWPDDRKAIETGDFVYDISKIKRVIGWNPATSLDEGLKKTVEFYRVNKEKYW